MGDPLRESVPLRRLAESGQVIEFSAKVADFERLVGSIQQDLDAHGRPAPPDDWLRRSVRGELVFRYRAPGDEAIVLVGRAATAVPVVCQRCLELFDYPLVADMRLVFDVPGAGRRQEDQDGYESWEVPGPAVTPADIVDENLVMSLPLAPKHIDSATCGPGEEPVDDGMTRPFASLKARMKKKDSQ